METITGAQVSIANSIDWVETTSAVLDLYDAGSFVTSSTSLIGDLTGIFFNALERFA